MFYYYLQLMQQSLAEMGARKIRTLLIMIGIVWGTLSVTLLLALGESFRQTNESQVTSLATGAALVWVSSTTKPYHGLPAHVPLDIKADSVMNLPELLPHVQAVSPMMQLMQRASIHGNQRTAYGRVSGVAHSFDKMLHITQGAHQGRFFSAYQTANHRHVAYLGYRIKEKLFGQKNALGKWVNINGMDFLVVGYQDNDNSRKTFFKSPNSVYIPYTAFADMTGSDKLVNFWVKTDNKVSMQVVTESMKRYFAHQLHYDPTDDGALVIFDLAQELEFFTKFFVLVEWFLAFCGIVALCVGAFSVTNTLFLSVRERTREIGLRLALGAKPRHILWQFILEALLIVAMAGIIGIILAGLIVFAFSVMPLPDWLGVPHLSLKVLATTLLILAVMGLLAGFFPARRAAKMKPAQALLFS